MEPTIRVYTYSINKFSKKELCTNNHENDVFFVQKWEFMCRVGRFK